jgi:excisionase family DNA binding protein
MNAPAVNFQRCLTTGQVAEVLSCTASHVRRLVREKRLAGVKIGVREYRIPSAALERFLERERVGA